MASVTQRIKQIKQPYGGYIRPSMFSVKEYIDDTVLNPEENIHASVVGMAVDYLVRLELGADLLDAFKISWKGAQVAEDLYHRKRTKEIAWNLMANIKQLDEQSIINTCKMVTFDVWYRNPVCAETAKDYRMINPDINTVHNIKTMVLRSLRFLQEYAPIVAQGFTFEPNGYTKTVHAGDGDFLTTDTIWDFKVSKSEPKKEHTLQLLMYWIMGKHSGQAMFEGINKLGIFNPRLNKVYILNTSTIPKEVISEVEHDIICY